MEASLPLHSAPRPIPAEQRRPSSPQEVSQFSGLSFLVVQVPDRERRTRNPTPQFSVVEAEIRAIQALLSGHPTTALNTIIEQRQGEAEESLKRLEAAKTARAQCGLFDWIFGRTALRTAELAEAQEEHDETAQRALEAERMGQRLELAVSLLSKRQPTLALRHLQFLQLNATVDLRLKEPIARIERMLAR